MNEWIKILNKFLYQTQTEDLKYASYPKEWSDLVFRVSFGMGTPAKIPWICLITPEMRVSEGYYPGYLYIKETNTLILSYGISETMEYESTWPDEILDNNETLHDHLNGEVPRYGKSYVCKSYKIDFNKDKISFIDLKMGKKYSDDEIVSHLEQLLDVYKKSLSIKIRNNTDLPSNQGVFYMEKQLEDFIVHNWADTELGKKYDLIIKDGEQISQQYKTAIGFIDILAKDKNDDSYVVIELKKDQTSDKTVGQITRYMGWVKKNLNTPNVRGVIIASGFDKKLEYALEVVNDIDVYIYEVDFRLKEFT